jgi:hypothetical protein
MSLAGSLRSRREKHVESPNDQIRFLNVPPKTLSIYIFFFTLMGALFFGLIASESFNFAICCPSYEFWLLLLILDLAVLAFASVGKWWKFYKFERTMEKVKKVIMEVVQQSKSNGIVDLNKVCAFCPSPNTLLPYRTFKENFVRNIEYPDLNNIGDLDLETGKFYSYTWFGTQELKQEDLATIASDFEQLGGLNVTQFAQKRGVDVDTMRVLFFRYCGAKNIGGRVEIAPNGDYFAIPDEAFTGDFVHKLDEFIQEVLIAESTGAGKKAGGKV